MAEGSPEEVVEPRPDGRVEPNPELTRKMVPSLRMLAPQILVAGILPVVVYGLIRPHVGSDATGLSLVMVFPIAEIAFERQRQGRFEPIGIISLVGIALGIIGALVFHGDTVLLKVRGSVITGVFGLGCLVSLAMRRPAMWHMGKAFATEADPDKAAEFDQLWSWPSVPRRFKKVTAIWGVALVGEACAQLTMALNLSTQTFLALSLVLNGGVLFGLIAYTTVFTRASERYFEELQPVETSTTAA
ncbi:MAG: VC0807 family protein [Acidimicrobiales bacterium]